MSKAIDKAAGVTPIDLGESPNWRESKRDREKDGGMEVRGENAGRLTAPATPDAERWHGWGTALKPAHEPIVVARKPLDGTVAANVLAHGTGAINVDGCRVDASGGRPARETDAKESANGSVYAGRQKPRGGFDGGSRAVGETTEGRWPANLVLSHAEDCVLVGSGGASRFFYCAKASRAERNAGLAGARNVHPTVKPIELIRWLERLVTPPGGVILDMFAGSGTHGCAAVLEGFDFIGIERDSEYVAISKARIAWWAAHPEGVETAKVYAVERKRAETAAAGQAGLFDETAA